MKTTVKIIAIAILLMANNLYAQLEYGSYFGKMNNEEFNSLTRDKNGNLYFVGLFSLNNGNSPDLPTNVNSFQKNFGGGTQDYFMASFDKNFNLRWCTYIGGTSYEESKIKCQILGDKIYVCLHTTEKGFAINSTKKTIPQKSDVLIMKFNLNGKIIGSTYLGGSQDEYFSDFEIDNSSNILITGTTNSRDSIGTNPSYCRTYPGTSTSTKQYPFLLKLDTNLILKYGTYIGNIMAHFGYAYNPQISFDSKNNYYLGYTTSGDGAYDQCWITKGANKTSPSGGLESVLSKFTANNVLEWSTFLGGDNDDKIMDILVDFSTNDIFVYGKTSSSYYLIDSTIFPKISNKNSHGFLAKFNSSGNRIFCRYLGGNGIEESYFTNYFSRISKLPNNQIGVIVSSGYPWSGTKVSTNQIYGNYPYYKIDKGGTESIFYILKTSGEISWSTYLGGNNNDIVQGVYIENSKLCFWGNTASTQSIATDSGAQNYYGGGVTDVFIQKFTLPLNTDLTLKYPSKQCLDKNIFYVNDNSTAFDTNYVVVDSISDGTVYQKKSYSHSFKKPGTYYIKHSIYYKNNPNYVSQVTKVVEVYPNPTITKISVVKDTVYQGQQFQLSTSSIDSISYIQWKLDTSYIGAGKSVYYQTDSLGKRKIECIVVSNHGCVSRFYSSIIVIKKLTTSTKELNQKDQQLVFPNPTNNILNIASSFYEIYDLTGKLIVSGNSQNQIDVSNLSLGTYFLKTNVGNFKFIKE
jgi:hypothetical protein